MIIGFAIWSIVFLVLLGIGIQAWKSDKAVGFYTGTKPPDVTDVRKYNRSVAVLWFVYAGLFELLGLPLLFLKQNSLGFLGSVAGVPVITIALAVVYSRILRKYERKKRGCHGNTDMRAQRNREKHPGENAGGPDGI